MEKKPTKKRKLRFASRLFLSVFFLYLGFVVSFLLFQYKKEYDQAQHQLNSQLVNYNHELYELTKEMGDPRKAASKLLHIIPQKDLRVTIIDSFGKVLFDNHLDGDLENHYNRKEVREARDGKNAFAVRVSASEKMKYFYSAKQFDKLIYRSALPFNPYIHFFIQPDYIIFLLITTLLYVLITYSFAHKINKTISRLQDFAATARKGGMPDESKYVFPNDELGDISKDIIHLYNNLSQEKEKVQLERGRIEKHFQYADYGFAMFTYDGKELISNVLFLQFANLISTKQITQSEEVFNIPELHVIKTQVDEAMADLNRTQKTMHFSLVVEKSGKIFQIECILFVDNNYELSISDITQLEEEQRLKRQLTQNVAHELKTPVSSISGYLETLLNTPNLEPDKARYFMERSYTQSQRLKDLLLDISTLNRLDEASLLYEREDVDIQKMVEEIVAEYSKPIEEKSIQVHAELENHPIIRGNRSLLYSIFRNLLDNSIHYAGTHIQITIACFRETDQYYYFNFSDNGVGISEEHLSRIFERFYRIDKGRSRKVGGTGLGLSIVKNAVQFHEGNVFAKSQKGEGVEFIFTLKKNRI